MNLSFFFTGIFYLLAFKISYEDWTEKEVKAFDLFFLVMLCFMPYFLAMKDFPNIYWLVCFFVIVLFIEAYLKKKIMGNADWIVLLAIASRLSFPQIPFFLMLSGSLGIITFWIKKEKMIPFLPSLFLALLVCELCPLH